MTEFAAVIEVWFDAENQHNANFWSQDFANLLRKTYPNVYQVEIENEPEEI